MTARVSHLPIRLKLNPGQPGTKKLLARYGRELVCVRYRYDQAGRKRYKTVELVIDVADWWPGQRHKASDLVWVLVAFTEIELWQKVRDAGGAWSQKRQLWQLRYDKVVQLGLRGRVVKDKDKRRTG